MEELFASEPSPDVLVATAEIIDLLMKSLAEPELQRIAQLKLEGYSSEEIARHLGRTTRTIQRKLERIQTHWRQSGLDP